MNAVDREPEREALAKIVQIVIETEMMYDEEDWTRIADAILSAGYRREEQG